MFFCVVLKVGTVALVLVDEVHTIGEERGATLEVILTRMKLVSRSPEVCAALGITLREHDDYRVQRAYILARRKI